MFRNLKVRSKLLLSFGIMMVFYIISIIVANIGLGSVLKGLDNFYERPYPMVRYSLEAESSTRQTQLNMFRALTTEDEAKSQELLAQVNTLAQTMTNDLDKLTEVYGSDDALVAAALDAAADLKKSREDALTYLEAHQGQKALAVLNGEYADAGIKFQEAIDAIIERAETNAEIFYEDGHSTKRSCTILLVGVAVFSLIVICILAVRLNKSLTSPIVEIEGAVKEMAKGNMHTSVTYESNDELGGLAENLRFLLKTLSGYIEHISQRLGSLAEGDLSVEMDMDYLGDFQSLKHSCGKIIESLNDAMSQLHQASDQVAEGSEQVSSGAQALSQGATEQASSVEELVATLSELSDKVNKTAHNARDVNDLMGLTVGEIDNSNKMMESMMTAMTRINECSSEIEKIIKTIEDIAFQTNILALNAAVEAARAGEAGKGFAVVADEVRSLASKSQEAAKDTTALISNSLTAVSEGNQIASDTQESLLKVVSSAQKISENMAAITEASDMQAEGIQQVTQGIDQISSVIQTNSATAQESAAASEELYSQSSLLKSLVGRFRLKKMAGPMTPVAARTPDPIPVSVPVSDPIPEPIPAPVSDTVIVPAPAPKAPVSSGTFVDDMAKY
ncbi:MAG: HAMP domain-containing protein, partial [Dorea sp.]|nr:HAMP domain-containing protein [Dorea sp.]